MGVVGIMRKVAQSLICVSLSHSLYVMFLYMSYMYYLCCLMCCPRCGDGFSRIITSLASVVEDSEDEDFYFDEDRVGLVF